MANSKIPYTALQAQRALKNYSSKIIGQTDIKFFFKGSLKMSRDLKLETTSSVFKTYERNIVPHITRHLMVIQ